MSLRGPLGPWQSPGVRRFALRNDTVFDAFVHNTGNPINQNATRFAEQSIAIFERKWLCFFSFSPKKDGQNFPF
jgi:hypothetical protein